MTTETLILSILSHTGEIASAVAATVLYLRHMAGWVTAFEATIKADIAELRSIMTLYSRQQAYALPAEIAGLLPPLPAAPVSVVSPVIGAGAKR
jgi:hypothetical protein